MTCPDARNASSGTFLAIKGRGSSWGERVPAANVGLTAQNFLRRNFWVFHLIFIAIACYLAAGIVTEIVAAKLLKGPEPTTDATGLATVASTRPVKPVSKVSLMGTLTGHNIFDAEPVIVEGTTETDQGNGPPLTDLGVELLGTLVSRQREWSLATIKMQNASKLVREGVLLGERATVTEIASRYIVLEDGPQRLVVRLWDDAAPGKPGAPKPPGPAAAAPKPAATPGGEFAKGVKKTGAYEYQLDRNMLNENLQDLSKLGMQARIVPNYENGKYSGFRLVGIAPDSLYKAIGLESGDLIRRVGGKDLDSPNKAIELFDQLRNSSAINLDVERRGQKVSMQYQIK